MGIESILIFSGKYLQLNLTLINEIFELIDK